MSVRPVPIRAKAAIVGSWAVIVGGGCTGLAMLPNPGGGLLPPTDAAVVFGVVMTCVYVLGYVAYKHQAGGPSSSGPVLQAYWPAIKLAVIEQAIVAILAVLMLDLGQSIHITLVSLTAYWPAVCLIVIRRPSSPTVTDVEFVKFGFLLILSIVAIAGTSYWIWVGRW